MFIFTLKTTSKIEIEVRLKVSVRFVPKVLRSSSFYYRKHDPQLIPCRLSPTIAGAVLKVEGKVKYYQVGLPLRETLRLRLRLMLRPVP